MSRREGIVLFDLDGTLTMPVLDFDAIRAEIGLPPGPILESLAKLDDAGMRRGLDVLDRHEREAVRVSSLQPGARETVAVLRQKGWVVAVVTRNATRPTQQVLDKHGIVVDAIRTRDDGEIKPSPRPILDLCRRLRCDPRRGWMIGDHLFDIQSGQAAGCTTVLFIGQRDPPDYAPAADHVIRELCVLPDLIGRPPQAPPGSPPARDRRC